MKMGFMTDEEYTRKFLELLRYVPYLKEEKEKIQRSISGMSIAFKYMIKFDEPRSLEEAIIKLNNVIRNQSVRKNHIKDGKGN